MKAQTSPALATALASLILAQPLVAAGSEWPQWRGPTADGVALEGSSPPVRWSETENIQWKIQLPGEGASTPIIWGDLVFLLSAEELGTTADAPARGGEDRRGAVERSETAEGEPPRRRRGDRAGGGGRGDGGEGPRRPVRSWVVAVERDSGEIRWKTAVKEAVPHEGHHRDHGYASHSPVTDGERIYAFMGSRGLYCLDLEGEVKWEKDLGQMVTRSGFGEGASPALHGDVLVVPWDHEGEDFVVALDKTTGEELWRAERDEPTSWATPLIVEHGGITQVVVSATERIRSYELHTGELLWEVGGMTTNVIPSPVSDGSHVYAMSGFRGSALLAIRLGYRGDLSGGEAISWSSDRGTPYVPSPLLSGKRLYFFAGNTGTLSCYDTNAGEVLMDRERIEDLLGGIYASPVAADGRVYLVGRSGAVVVMKDDGSFEILASNQLDDGFDASPAIAGDRLFLRGRENLYCIGE
jgi:outer membrane protein assembly factor BamB